MKQRGFEIAKGWEDKGINLPVRKTKYSAGYDVEAAEDVVIPPYKPGIKPTLIPTGLKKMSAIYCLIEVVDQKKELFYLTLLE